MGTACMCLRVRLAACRPVPVTGRKCPMASELPPHQAAVHYKLSLLATFALQRDGLLLDTNRWQRSSLTLLKLLATAPNWRRSRDELIDTTWPDSEPQAGASSLRSALHVLRRGL